MTAPSILAATLSVFRCSDRELFGKRKHRNAAHARMVAAHLLRTGANESNEAIARRFRKSPSWPSKAVYACEDLAEVDKEFARKCAAVAHIARSGGKAVAA